MRVFIGGSQDIKQVPPSVIKKLARRIKDQ
jgi:hypothetical protein